MSFRTPFASPTAIRSKSSHVGRPAAGSKAWRDLDYRNIIDGER